MPEAAIKQAGEDEEHQRRGRRAVAQRQAEKDQGRQQLQGRVARRDGRAAAAAAPAQDEIGEHRHVLERRDGAAAGRTARPRPHHRLAARQPVDHDVEERADHQAEDDGDARHDERMETLVLQHGRRLAAARVARSRARPGYLKSRRSKTTTARIRTSAE